MNQDELKVLEERIKANPKSRSFLQLAEAYIENGRRAEAIELLRNGEEFYPYYLAARITYGRLLREEGDLDKAIDQFEFVNRTIPDNLIALKNLAHLYLEKSRLSDARTSANSVLALSPNDPEMVDLLAKISDLEKKESPANRPASGPVSEGETRAPAPPAPEPAPKIPQEPPKEQLEEPVAESSHEETVVELPQDLFEEVQNSLPEPPVEPVPEPLPEESVTAGPEPPAPEPEPAAAQEEVPLPEPVPPADSGVLDETAGLASGGMPQTETMGDLLFDQGHTEKALSVYQNVLQRDPDSKALQEKIRAAKMILRMMPEEAASGPPVPPPAPTPEPEPVPEELPREPEPALLAEEKPAVPESLSSPPLAPPEKEFRKTFRNRDLPDRILERVSSRMGRDLLGYVLSTRDGLPVESTDAGRWADVLAAEGMEFVRSVGDAARMLDWGEFRGTVVWMDRAILYGVPIEESRGLFLVLKPESNIGLCRLLVQEAFESVESDGEQR